MKAFRANDESAVLTLEAGDVVDLVVFLVSEQQRRYRQFDAGQVMECWPCFLLVGEILKALEEAGFKRTGFDHPQDHSLARTFIHHRRKEGDE